jgi:hypothetical protein
VSFKESDNARTGRHRTAHEPESAHVSDLKYSRDRLASELTTMAGFIDCVWNQITPGQVIEPNAHVSHLTWLSLSLESIARRGRPPTMNPRAPKIEAPSSRHFPTQQYV